MYCDDVAKTDAQSAEEMDRRYWAAGALLVFLSFLLFVVNTRWHRDLSRYHTLHGHKRAPYDARSMRARKASGAGWHGYDCRAKRSA